MDHRKIVDVTIPGGAGYSVTIGTALETARQAAVERFGGGRLLVTDDNVAPHYLAGVAADCGATETVTRPAGEATKTPAKLFELVRTAAAARLDRAGVIIALGGGVIGDLAGLAAALFMRGIAFVNFPTSLLAMVDASIGGKTAVDLPEGKNLLGAFHQPAAVVADISMLSTLPDAEWRSGMAELIKTALVGDAALLDLLEHQTLSGLREQPAQLVEIVHRAATVKAGVVMRDEREAGERMKLNAGHTIGHALESASGYALSHGAAVAIGLVAEATIAERLGLPCPVGFVARLSSLLASFGLPVTSDPALAPAAISYLAADKKHRAGRLHMALPVAPGDVQIRADVPPALLEEALHGKR